MNIEQKYKELINTPSDINEHLPTLFNLAKEVESIIEMGTRHCISATAFIAAIVGTEKSFITYDLYRSSAVEELEKYNNFKFCLADTLSVRIPEADLLFIDTLHTYFQLLNELKMHSKNIKKYIVLHDTSSYGQFDEPFYSEKESMIMSDKVQRGDKNGLMSAINDFLEKEEDGRNWKINKVYENNNGLTILKRF